MTAKTTTRPVAFLGPEGTFTEEALLANMPAGDLHPYPYPSVNDVMLAVQNGEAALGLVPIENSLEGAVAVTHDLLAFGFEDLSVVREVTHTIRHQLIARQPLELVAGHQGHQPSARVRPVPHVHPEASGRRRA